MPNIGTIRNLLSKEARAAVEKFVADPSKAHMFSSRFGNTAKTQVLSPTEFELRYTDGFSGERHVIKVSVS